MITLKQRGIKEVINNTTTQQIGQTCKYHRAPLKWFRDKNR